MGISVENRKIGFPKMQSKSVSIKPSLQLTEYGISFMDKCNTVTVMDKYIRVISKVLETR